MTLINTVEWDNKSGDIIHEFPEGAISVGAQLIVKEHQEAVVFHEGRALDSFGPGRYTLKRDNIPMLEDTVTLPSGRKNSVPAEVYYINKSEVPNLKWGTKHPVQLLDPVYHIAIPVRAFGNYSIRIEDARSLLMMAIGTWSAYTSEAVGEALRDQIILPKFQDLLSETIIKQNLSILKISAFLDEIGISAKIKISEDFASFGIELVRFAIESINVPEEDESVKRLKKALADKAEIGIIGQEDYKLKRTFDTMEKAAESDGSMIGSQMGKIIPEIIQNDKAQEKQVIKCPHCNADNRPDAVFCSSCGKGIALDNICPNCNKKVEPGAKFCPECGENLQERTCPRCKTVVKPGTNFCPECGRKLK
jgi:membrane protease subunit (stomatin/prohibitin family)